MRKLAVTVGILCLFISLIYEAHSTCVLASDFGFTLNCAFKKSGLFRVRNLGGVKAHFGLGFSVGDELGFNDSLTNKDPSKRRSTSIKNGATPNAIGEVVVPNSSQTEKRGKQNRLIVKQPSSAEQATTFGTGRAQRPVIVMDVQQKHTLARPLPANVPPFKPIPQPKEETLKVIPMQQIPQSKGPGLAYQQNQISKMLSQMPQYQQNNRVQFMPTSVTAFVPMPPPPKSVSFVPSIQVPIAPTMMSKTPTVNTFMPSMMSITQPVEQRPYPVFNDNIINKADDDVNSIGYDDDPAAEINEKILAIAKAANISMEAVEAAIVLRQQQLLNQYANIPMPTSSSTTSTTTTTPRPTHTTEPYVSVTKRSPPQLSASGKVMNAPREYYPIGYEKNFDDKFESKVELPETSFYCGDQKYFPGLYGDENLGCMVFHVCALTDDGLVMKSFLCPESTLFDQTILKCNWWFYVDCKNTKSLYDTNIPVSKSYQLMKALTFFSSYKKELENENGSDNKSSDADDMIGVQKAISILEEHGSSPTTIEPITIVTAKPSTSNQKIPRFSLNRQNRNKKPKENDSMTQASEQVVKTVDEVIIPINEIVVSNNSEFIANTNTKSNDTTENVSNSSESSIETSSESSRKRERYSMKRTKTSTAAPRVSSTVKPKRRYSTRTTTTTTTAKPIMEVTVPEIRLNATEKAWSGNSKNEEASTSPSVLYTNSSPKANKEEQSSTRSTMRQGDMNVLRAALNKEKVYVVNAQPMTEFEKQYNMTTEVESKNNGTLDGEA